MTDLPYGVTVPKWHVLCKVGEVIPANVVRSWWFTDRGWIRRSLPYGTTVNAIEFVCRPMTPSEIRAQAMEDACKAVCEHCANGYVLRQNKFTDHVKGDVYFWWVHEGERDIEICDANAIREAFREESES